jgi:sigma-B regulation protein RsbU (phosphoserine phosphatase)
LNDSWSEGLRDPARLLAVERSGLVGTGPDDSFDRLTELAAVLTGAPWASVALVGAERYTVKSRFGIPDNAPLSGRVENTFCHYVVGSSRPLIVVDARNDSLTHDHPATVRYGVAAYVGYPIEDAEGAVLGTFCVIDPQPHAWTATDLHVIATLAKAASSEVALYRARQTISSARVDVAELRAVLDRESASVPGQPQDPVVLAVIERAVQIVRGLQGQLEPAGSMT